MHHFIGGSPKWVLTPQKETSSLVSKMIIFQRFFRAFMIHIIRWNSGKKIELFFELFIHNIFEYTYVGARRLCVFQT